MSGNRQSGQFSTEQALQAFEIEKRKLDASLRYSKADARLVSSPDHVESMRDAANALIELGRAGDALRYFDRLLAIDPRDASAWCDSGHAARLNGNSADALIRVTRACELEPANRAFSIARRALSGQVVPIWHFAMLNDAARTNSYAAAIRRHVGPGRTVLEIGTGVGLVAMLAARAGARHVYTCEANPTLAAIARDNIARNRLTDRITVIGKMSTQLALGHDIPERADILVSELFSPQMLAEEIVPSIEDARSRLLTDSATVIPAQATLRLALVDGPSFANFVRVGRIEEIDLSGLNDYTPTVTVFRDLVNEAELQSDSVSAYTLDFRCGAPLFRPHAREVSVCAKRSGLCQGALQWLHVSLDEQSAYENNPTTSHRTVAGHLPAVFYPFEAPVAVMAGEVVTLELLIERNSVQVNFRRIEGDI